MKKYKKIAKVCFVALAIFLLKTNNVFAEAQCQVSATKGATVDLNRMSECMEDRYGFDKDALRRAGKKVIAPTVEITFNKTDPKEGEKVTALSAPKGFRTDMGDLYYTWYIVHHDNEGRALNTIEAGKREAMGIIARGNFDPTLFNINYGTIPPALEDDDGFDASYGGSDGVGAKLGDGVGEFDDDPSVMFDAKKQIVRYSAITRCYRHNFGKQVGSENMGDSEQDARAGRDEIKRCSHEFARCGVGRIGDGDFDVAEEECWGTDPTNSDTDSDGIEDEADLAGLNQTQFTWIYRPGDEVGLVVEGTSMLPISEGGEMEESIVEGFNVTDPTTGVVRLFATSAQASAFCSTFLPASLNFGSDLIDADMTAYNDGMANYDSCDNSITEAFGSGVTTGSGELNAYYKIMWATTGICSNHDDSMRLRLASGGPLDDDGCEPGNSDWGFNYLSTVPVNEVGGNILDPELSVIPENPQFDAVEPVVEQKRSDLITVNASMSNEVVNEDFLFYSWQVDRCNGNDFTDCNHPIPNASLIYETFTEGMGVRELKFFPTSAIFGAVAGLPALPAGDNKVWLRVSVIVSEHESLAGGIATDPDGRTVGAIEKIYFPVTKNVVAMNLYKAIRNGGVWTRGPQICNTDLYKDICPVYPYEVLVAEAVTADGTAPFDRYAWNINSGQIESVVNCRISGGVGCGTTPEEEVFFTVRGSEDSTASISVSNKRSNSTDGATDFISQRLLSISNPKAVIEPVAGAVATERFDGTASNEIFEADNSTTVTFRAVAVPRYMIINTDAVQDDNEVDLVWYINNREVDADFIADNVMQLNTVVAGDQITFTIPPDMTLGSGIDLKARIIKNFSSGGVNEYVEMLKDTWRIIDTHTLAKDTSISVKVAFNMALAQDTTLKQYLASSINNAPHYLLFVIRLAIAMVLIWSILFGLAYAVKLNKAL